MTHSNGMLASRVALMIWLVALISTALPVSANAGWFGPDNQAECILEYVDKAQVDKAATLIYRVCSTLFTSKGKAKSTPVERARAECLLENLPKAKTDRAVQMTYWSCQELHAEKQRYWRFPGGLSRRDLDALADRCGFFQTPGFLGRSPDDYVIMAMPAPRGRSPEDCGISANDVEIVTTVP